MSLSPPEPLTASRDHPPEPPGGPSPGDPPEPGATIHGLHLAGSERSADESFTDFYRDAWEQVARGLSATLGDRELATEATDEAMARAYERWAKVRTYDFPAGWVYRVALNWSRSHHRRLARALPARRQGHAEIGVVADPAVRDALLALDVRHRTVVVCRIFLDWSVEETATALGIAPGTVKSRLSRALSVLQSSLSHLR